MNKRKRRVSAAKEQFWRQHVETWRKSGLSVRAYCVGEMLAEPSFYGWRHELAQRDAQRAKTARRQGTSGVPHPVARSGQTAGPAWVELQVTPAPGREASLEIELPGGRFVRLRGAVPPETLADVLAVLERRPC